MEREELSASSVPNAEELMREHEMAAAVHGPKEDIPSEVNTKLTEEIAEPSSVNLIQSNGVLDISSDEVFPSLGAATKPVANMTWGNLKSTTTAATSSNGPYGRTTRAPVFAGGAMARHRDNTEYTAILELQAHERLLKSQMKKSAADIGAEVAKRTSTNVELSTTMTGVLVILIKGSIRNVERAKKELRKELCPKQNISVSIPAFIRPHIIGKQGTVVQKIQQDTGTKITIPKMADGELPVLEDDGTAININIEGDLESVRLAKSYIDRIVAERTAHTSIRLDHIPGQFYPFIAGPNYRTISELQEGKDLKIHIPEYYYTKTREFSPATEPITIKGEKVAANEAKEKLETLYQDLTRNFIHMAAPIPKIRHRFLYGDRGQTMHQILEETGCSVVLPTPEISADICLVTGPRDKIGQGVSKVTDIAMAPKCAVLDITKAHPDAPIGATAHAVALTRLFRLNKALDIITGAQIEPPNVQTLAHLQPNSPVCYFFAADSNEELAESKSKFQKIVTKYSPQRIQHIPIDPIWHETIRGPNGRDLRKLVAGEDIRVLVGDHSDHGSNVFIVYEGKPDADEEPSPHEISLRVQEVKEKLESVIKGLGEIIEETLKIDEALHPRIKGERNTTLNALCHGKVSIQLGTPTLDSVLIRGVPADVKATAKKIKDFVDELHKNGEADKPHLLAFDYPSEWSSMLIGSRGSNINKLRDELGVDIKLKEGKGEIRGVKANAEAAKKRLFEQIKNLENNRTITMKVPQEYHKSIIGAQGKLIRRLEERHNVRIHLGSRNSRDEDLSIDTPSEAGRGTRHDRAICPDEISIKGSKKDIEKTQKEIEELLAYEKEHSHTDTLDIAVKSIQSLLTTRAKDLKRIREDYGARIDIPHEDSSTAPDTKLQITIRGTKQEVEEVKKDLGKILSELDDTVKLKIDIEKQYHRALIGASGATLKSIIEQAGGARDRGPSINKMVRFPPQNSPDSEITIEGPQSVVDKIVEIIMQIVDEKKNQITEAVDVAPEKHRMLIGREGQVRRDLETEYLVTIDIPRYNSESPSPVVKITGRAENVGKAKARILEITKDMESITVMVPTRIHYAVADNGFFIRKLKTDLRVVVGYDGQPLPAKPVVKAPMRQLNGADLPLITDSNHDESQAYSWEIVESEDNGEEGDFPWVLRGSSENIAKAKSLIEEACEEVQKQSSTGYLILPDPSKYRFVVGPAGSTVNKIRADTGCRITIPRDKSDGEAIVLHGTKEGLEKAKDAILEAVKDKGNGETDGMRRYRGPRRT